MRLILIGCEYVGKTTLADALQAWGLERGRNFHMDDHFTIPDAQHVSEEEQEAMLALPGAIKERLPAFPRSSITCACCIATTTLFWVGFHIEEAIYGPRYYYPGLAMTYERQVEPEFPRDAVLVLLTAAPR